METSQNLIGSREVARRFGKNRATIQRWAQIGRLDPVVVVPGYNGDFLFDEAAIVALTEGSSDDD